MVAPGWRLVLSTALVTLWHSPPVVNADLVSDAGVEREVVVDAFSLEPVAVASSSVVLIDGSSESFVVADDTDPVASQSIADPAASESIAGDTRRRRGGGVTPIPSGDFPDDAMISESLAVDWLAAGSSRRRGGGFSRSRSGFSRSRSYYDARRRYNPPSPDVRRRYSPPSPSYDVRRRYSPTPSPSYDTRRRYSPSPSYNARRRYHYDSARRRFGHSYVWQRRRRQWQNAAAFGVGAGFTYYAITGTRRRYGVWAYSSAGDSCRMAPAYTVVPANGAPSASVPAIQRLCAQMLNASQDPQTTCFQCDQCTTNACVNAIPGCNSFTQTLYYQCQDPGYGRNDFMTWLSSLVVICLSICCVCCVIGCIVKKVKESNAQTRDVQMSLISDPGPGSFTYTGAYPGTAQPTTPQQPAPFDTGGYPGAYPGTTAPTPFDERFGHAPMQQPFNVPDIQVNQPYPVYNQGAPAMGAGQTGPQQFQVEVPLGAGPGSYVQVTAPNGQTVQVVVPPGVGPGQQFTAQL